jgi:hypothetical protein
MRFSRLAADWLGIERAVQTAGGGNSTKPRRNGTGRA